MSSRTKSRVARRARQRARAEINAPDQAPVSTEEPRIKATPPAAKGSTSAGPAFPEKTVPPALERWASSGGALVGVIVVGLLLRFGHLWAFHDTPFFAHLELDARYYDKWAQDIAAGAWIGKAAFWVDPLYAYFLGALYKTFGHDLVLPRLANIVFGLVGAWLTARAARRVWESSFAAVLAAALFVLFVPLIHFESQVEKTALTVMLLALAMDLFLDGSRRAVVALGVVLGLASLARGNALVFAPAVALAMALGWTRWARGSDVQADAKGARKDGRGAALVLGAFVPVILLATLHNRLASAEATLTTTNLGINLYLGNHEGNQHGHYTPPAFLHPETGDELPDFRAEAERRLGHALTDAALSSYWRDQALASVVAHPGAAFARTFNKLQMVLSDDEIPDSEDVDMVAEWSPVLRMPLLWMGELLPLAALGIAVGWRRQRARAVAAMAALYILSLLPFFVMARLRVQLLPMLAVLGGGGASWLVAVLQPAERGPWLWRAAAVMAATLVPAYYRPAWMIERRVSSLAIGWNNLGANWVASGNSEEAIRAYDRAVAINEAAVPAALRALGMLHRERGDLAAAEKAMRRVVELRPNSPSARRSLADLYGVMLADQRFSGDAALRERARALVEARPAAEPAKAEPPSGSSATRDAAARARALSKDGKHAEAVAILQEAVRNGPYDEGLHYLLGSMMERHASPDEMVRFWSEEVARDMKPQTSHYFWSIGLSRRGDLEGALAELRRALGVDPAHEMSHRQWGILLEGKGDLKGALEHLEEAAEIHPDFRAALEDAARVARKLGKADLAASFDERAKKADPSSPRRYLHWAKYLHEKGRDSAALAEIDRMLAERPGDPEALDLRKRVREALGKSALAVPEGPLSEAAAEAMSEELRRAGAHGVWLTYDPLNGNAEKLARALGRVFEEAGWKLRSLRPASFSLKPGVFLFAASETTPASSAAERALARSGLSPQIGTEYRAFVEERRRTDPRFRGFDFEEDQDFLIAVGRRGP